MHDFGTSTPRIQAFRQELLNIVPGVCTERAVLTTRAYKAHEMDQVVLKRAYMVKEILENMSIYIEPETLIVGNQAKSNRSAPIFPEYAMDWVIRELDEFDKRPGDRFTITEENKQILRDIYPYWKGRTLQDKGYAAFPERAKLIYDLGIIRNEGNITSGDAHLAVDYKAVLEKGLDDFRRRTREKLDGLNTADPKQMKSSYFYRAILIVIDAVECYARRFAGLAEAEAVHAQPERAQELKEIARICRKVPMQPAETFHEALQSVWFIHLILQIESNGHSLSFGRFDQYCYPYYEKSLADGATVGQLEELLENLWLKTLTINKIRSWGHSRFAAGSPLYQNITIGGQTTEGEDAVNGLTWSVLRSVARTHLPQPNLTVRYFAGMSREFMAECIECIRLGFGMPAFNNDEIIIKALTDREVTLEDARNYSAIGCVEVAVPGKWGYRCTGMSYLNFPKTLMTALNDGVDVNTGKKICEGSGHFLDMESFDDVMQAWDMTARQLINIGVTLDNCADMVVEQEVPDILCSCLVDDCIERGLHLKEGGASLGRLQTVRRGEFLPKVDRRREERERIAGNVNEFRVRETLQNRANASGVRRRLQNNPLAAPDRQLFEEVFERVEPTGTVGVAQIAERQIIGVDATVVRERDFAVRRRRPERADRELVFLRTVEPDGHIVHWAFFRHQIFNPRTEKRPANEEVRRREAVVSVGAGEAIVAHHVLVKERRSAAPVPDDKDRRVDKLRVANFFAARQFLPTGQKRVGNGQAGNNAEHRETRRRDSPTTGVQNLEPSGNGYAVPHARIPEAVGAPAGRHFYDGRRFFVAFIVLRFGIFHCCVFLKRGTTGAARYSTIFKPASSIS